MESVGSIIFALFLLWRFRGEKGGTQLKLPRWLGAFCSWRGSKLIAIDTTVLGAAAVDMRATYIDIVKRWHPDRSVDSTDFFRRNHITMLANAAYANGDEDRLRALNDLKQG